MSGEWGRTEFVIDNVLHTPLNIIGAIETFLLSVGWERASWSGSGTDRYYLRVDRLTESTWQFTGDGATKYGGIRVFYDATPNVTAPHASFASQLHIVIQSFLQNAGASAAQVKTPDFVADVPNFGTTTPRLGTIRVKYETTAPNTYLLIGGEHGLYVEVGRSGLLTNLGHGAILTFDAIAGLHDPYAYQARWTAQGLVCDFFGACRFTESRNTRFVTNDGTSRNFTARLKPYAPRGTWSLASAQVQDQWPYYVGSIDSFLGMGHGSAAPSNADPTLVNLTANANPGYHATFGLLNTPQNSQFRVSPMAMLQSLERIACGVDATTAGDTLVPTTVAYALEPRSMRQINRFAVVDYSLVPFSLISDSVGGLTYRVVPVDDAGRTSQVGVEWPSQVVFVTP